MKHYLPRLSLLQVLCIAALALMFSPVAMAAGSSATSAVVDGSGLVSLAGLAGIGMMLRAPAEEHHPEGGGGEKSPDANADEAKLTLGQRLSAALSSKQSLTGKISQLEQLTEKQKADLKAKDEELVFLRAKVAKLEVDAADVAKALEAAEKEAKELAGKEQDLDARASEKAKQIVRGTGIDAGSLPSATDENVQKGSYQQAMEAYGKIDDPAKAAAYYAANIAPLIDKRG